MSSDNVRGALKAQDERNLRATESVGMFPAGCDTPEHLADEILGLRKELASVREINAIGNKQDRERLEKVRAKSAERLAMLVEHEWCSEGDESMPEDNFTYCIECYKSSKDGHTPDCKWVQAMKEEL